MEVMAELFYRWRSRAVANANMKRFNSDGILADFRNYENSEEKSIRKENLILDNLKKNIFFKAKLFLIKNSSVRNG